MKNILHIAVITLLLGFVIPDSIIAQQTVVKAKTATEKETEEALKKAQEDIKKSQEEIKKASDEQKKQMEEQMKITLEDLRGDHIYRVRAGEIDENFWFSPQGSSNFAMRGMPRTSWDFSKSVTDNSATKEYTFEVDSEMKTLSMSISGMCKTGEIRISILMPGSKSYSDVVIDELGNLNWRKSFDLNEESKDKIGVWKFKVTTTKATGSFRISLTAN